MFSCCLPTCRGSGFRKAKKKSLFSHYRHWLVPHLHRLWPFVRRSPQSCTQEVVKELANGFGYSISLDRGQLHRTIINNQGCSESEDESTLSVTEACRMRALQAGMMQRLSESVLPAFPSRVLCSVITSLYSYSGSSTSHQVLDQLFPRSHLPAIPGDVLIPFGTHGGSLAHCVRDAGGQDHLPNAIYFLLGTWLGQGQDCREPLRFPCWTLQLATLHVSFGGSHVEGHAYLLPGHLEHLKAIEAERKGAVQDVGARENHLSDNLRGFTSNIGRWGEGTPASQVSLGKADGDPMTLLLHHLELTPHSIAAEGHKEHLGPYTPSFLLWPKSDALGQK
ncbi:ral guanine nucleotide dissociation stimulator-like isoform X3 [Equus przewalskii]|uniref:Ral guanine nucleotide dissociation stimulator-like isoform X3 n=1 Tax=Equus przewalskii TaxID=9798 RepID=A0ABM4M8X9_EQUPR